MFVNWKLKVTPFSIKEFYMLLIIVSLFVIDSLLQRFVSLPLISMFNSEMLGLLFDAVLRTMAMFSLGTFIIYKSGISKQINDIVDKFLSFFKLI